MPFTLIVVVVAVAVSLLRGGRFARIADADLQRSWLLFAGLALQVGVDIATAREVLAPTEGYAAVALSQLLVLAWVASNWWRPGMVLVFVGLALNALVMGLNGGMPVDLDAVRALGFEDPTIIEGKHVVMTEETRLPWLADVLALPIVRTIISVGDLVLAAGLVPLTHHLMTYRPAHVRRGGRRGRDDDRATATPDTSAGDGGV